MNLTSILQQAGRHQWNPATFDIPLFLPGGFVLLWCWFWSSYFKVFKGGQQPLSPTCLAGDLSLQPTGEHRGEATTELPAAEKWGLWVQKPFSEVRNLPGFVSSSPWKSLGWVMSPWATPSTVSSSSVTTLRPQRLLSSQQTDSSNSRNGTAAAWRTWISSFSSENHSELQLALSACQSHFQVKSRLSAVLWDKG